MIQASGLAKKPVECPWISPFAGIMAGRGQGIMRPNKPIP